LPENPVQANYRTRQSSKKIIAGFVLLGKLLPVICTFGMIFSSLLLGTGSFIVVDMKIFKKIHK